MTTLNLWFQLGTQSRRAIRKTAGRFGKPYAYRPRGDLMRRLALANGMSTDQVYQQLLRERAELLRDF